jgi:hypothetical protein
VDECKPLNRGYYSRVATLRRMLDAFLAAPLPPNTGGTDAGGDEKTNTYRPQLQYHPARHPCIVNPRVIHASLTLAS